MTDPLTQLGTQYNTNKAFYHGYTRFYDKLLSGKRDSLQTMLEIGIDTGASMMMWRDYFSKADVYGIDLNIPPSVQGQPRLYPGIADQENTDQLRTLLASWKNPLFDFIIDDGGHHVKQQRVSFEFLWAHVKPGGLYIIEDLHTNILPFYYTHPHLSPAIISTYLDESPTVHERIVERMTGNETAFSIPTQDIEDVYYFSNLPTKSLSCAFVKKA